MLRLPAALLTALVVAAPLHAQPEVYYPFSISDAGNQSANAVAVGDGNSTFVVGEFSNSPDFDPTDGSFTLTSAGAFDVFLAKYDVNGALAWAFRLGDAGIEVGDGVATADGGVVITGVFDGSFDADPGEGETVLTAPGGLSDAFVARYDGEGNFEWAFQIGGLGADQGTAVAVDDDGDVVVVGGFGQSVDFDPGAGFEILTAQGDRDGFVAKFDGEDPTGEDGLLWAFALGGPMGGGFSIADLVTGVATGPDGVIAVTGQFEGTADFDPGDGTAENTTPEGITNAFVALYEGDQTLRWVNTLESEGENAGGGVAVNDDDEVFLTGQFSRATDFGSGTTLEPDFANQFSAPPQPYVARYEDGDLGWAFKLVALGTGRALALTPNGDVVVTGDFNGFGEVDFDPTDATLNVTGTGSPDLFVARYSEDRSAVFAFGLGGQDFEGEEAIENGLGVAVDEFGNTVAVGLFRSATLDMDPGEGEALVSNVGGASAFVAKYEPDGSLFEGKNVSNEPLAAGAEAALSAPYPNPAAGRARLTLRLDRAQHVRVEVFDALGRRVATVHDGALAAGPTPLALDAAALPSGTYLVRATGERFALAERATVIR